MEKLKMNTDKDTVNCTSRICRSITQDVMHTSLIVLLESTLNPKTIDWKNPNEVSKYMAKKYISLEFVSHFQGDGEVWHIDINIYKEMLTPKRYHTQTHHCV